jgi:hypothetical protein
MFLFQLLCYRSDVRATFLRFSSALVDLLDVNGPEPG